MAVSSINTSSSIASVARTKIQSKELVFAKAKISINGVSVQIGGTVEETARKINRVKDQTGVEARVVTNSSGVKTIQLVLKRGSNLRINDQDGVLKGLIGTTDKHLIKVIKANGQSKVSVQYTNAKENHNNTQELHLRSSTDSGSRKKVNNSLPPQIAELEADGAEPEHMLEAEDLQQAEDLERMRRDAEELQRQAEELQRQAEELQRQEEARRRLQEQQRRRERQEQIEERINDYANDVIDKVILDMELDFTSPEVIENVKGWVSEAINDYGLRERDLLGKGEQLKTLISQEIIDKGALFTSITRWCSRTFMGKLNIDEINTKDAVRKAISKLR